MQPFVVGFAGYGNVSRGAQEIYDLLSPAVVEPDALPASGEGFFKVVFEERHLVERKDGGFELQEYYDHPDRYRSIFDRHAPHLSVLINAIYWTEAYPRLLSKAYLEDANLRLLAVGDISCDIGGSIECTVKATTPGEPAYVYDPKTGAVTDGVHGDGLLMMTTDCLPAELPKESSSAFTEALLPFVPALANADYSGSFEAGGAARADPDRGDPLARRAHAGLPLPGGAPHSTSVMSDVSLFSKETRGPSRKGRMNAGAEMSCSAISVIVPSETPTMMSSLGSPGHPERCVRPG